MSGYEVGDRVVHEQYGDGTITRVNEYHTVIDFDTHGPRTFSSPRVVLTRSTTAAPVKPTRRKRVAGAKTTGAKTTAAKTRAAKSTDADTTAAEADAETTEAETTEAKT
jgi:hypothetical protein